MRGSPSTCTRHKGFGWLVMICRVNLLPNRDTLGWQLDVCCNDQLLFNAFGNLGSGSTSTISQPQTSNLFSHLTQAPGRRRHNQACSAILTQATHSLNRNRPCSATLAEVQPLNLRLIPSLVLDLPNSRLLLVLVGFSGLPQPQTHDLRQQISSCHRMIPPLSPFNHRYLRQQHRNRSKVSQRSPSSNSLLVNSQMGKLHSQRTLTVC